MQRITPTILHILALAISFAATPHLARGATFSVDRTDDAPSADNCSIFVDNDCSLRGAIIKANQDAEADIIHLPTGTYALTVVGILEDAAATGDLDITEALEIHGTDGVVIDGNGLDRVFHFTGGHYSKLYDLTIAGGTTYAGFTDVGGGGILNEGSTLVLTGCTVDGNSTHELGGGIYNRSGHISLNDSRITDNQSQTHGGGIFNQASASIVITDSTVDANVALGGGGGLYNNGLASLQRTSIYANHSHQGASHSRGGGIYNVEILNAINCSLLTNWAHDDDGGAIFNADTAALSHVSISGNNAQSGSAIASSSASTTDVANSLIIGECSHAGLSQSVGYNVESPGNSCNFDQPSDHVFVVDPLTSVESINGGPAMVLALEPGSVAIDTIDPADCTLADDQRALPRPIDGDGDGADACDSGAYELYAETLIFRDGFESGGANSWS